MMQLWFRLMTVLAAASVVGCASRPAMGPLVVSHTETTIARPPDVLLADCPTVTPPVMEAYAQAACTEREEVLSQYSQQLLLGLHRCTLQQQQLRAWYTAAERPAALP